MKCILGLTATANLSTAREIISHLGLKSAEDSVIGSTGIPENLHLSVSRDKDKDKVTIIFFSVCIFWKILESPAGINDSQWHLQAFILAKILNKGQSAYLNRAVHNTNDVMDF